MEYKVDEMSRILCNNKRVILLVSSINIFIKKRSTALAFHMTIGAIIAGIAEIQHILDDRNWSDFLMKVVDNVKFMACTKTLIVLYSLSINW